MVFGFISLSLYTTIHTIISLIGIVTGFIVAFEMIGNRPLGFWNTIFLWTTILTSVTGFFFPFSGVTPGIIVGIISRDSGGGAGRALRQHLPAPGAGSTWSARWRRNGSTCSC